MLSPFSMSRVETARRAGTHLSGIGCQFVRWDGDTRGRGLADATAFVDGAVELVDSMRTPDWVAEEPEAHLLPHLRDAVEGLPLALDATRTLDDGTFEVELAWTDEEDGIGQIRHAIYTLVGSVAETATYVRQRRDGDSVTFELVTGILGEGARFEPHGHAVRFRVALP
jgi:hypothetical protein